MKTKQEYIDTLVCITKEYYSTVRSPEEANKFNSYSRLFKELVDEHFEEKQENNYNHYMDEIIDLYIENLAISKGKMANCYATPCSKCDFADKNGHCIGINEIIKWLKQPYKKLTYKLSRFEYDLLRTNNMSHDRKLSSFATYENLREIGYFNYIDFDLTIDEILDNCEVIE